jgi:hypothetical protein
MPLEGSCLARQHEESGLEGILRVVHIPKNTTADAEHQRAVPVHQCSEGCLVVAVNE